MKKLFTLLIFLFCTSVIWSKDGLQIKGKLRLLKPATTLLVKDLNGKVILSCEILTNKDFITEQINITPDIYTLVIGNVEQNIFLENNPIQINGYFDEKMPERSSLNFTGIDSFLKLQSFIPLERDPDVAVISPSVKKSLTPSMASALAYLAKVNDYTSNKMLLDIIPVQNRTSQSAKWLVNRVNILAQQVEGAFSPDFTFVDNKGKNVSLKDFRGKIVVLDFCASWCGPCRKEMRNLLTIYNELKTDDMEFISVSLDNSESDWRKMMEEENLPWVMLWDKNGFPKSSESPSAIQTAYGFYSIPFLDVIDKEGKISARNVRGVAVKNAILKLRK